MPTTTLTNLQNYVTAIQKDKSVVSTGRKESYILAELMKKKKTAGGAKHQFSIRNGEQATNTKWFKPDASTDVIGTAGAYTQLDPVVNGEFAWSFIATDLRYSDLMLQQAKTAGANQLAEYLSSRLEFSEQEAAENIGDKIVNGAGDGKDGAVGTSSKYGPAAAVEEELYGLRYQNNFWGADQALATTLDNATLSTNTHFGLGRHLHSELVGNVLDATDGYGTTVSTNATFVEGDTLVTSITSTDLSQEIGWEIWIDWAGSGSYVPLGRQYVVAAQASGAQTVFNMSSVYRANDTGFAAGTYAIEIRAPYNTTDHGAASALTTSKMNKAYYQASDGMNQPNLALCSTRMFGAVQNFLVDQLRWTLQPGADIEAKGYNDSFKYLGATFVADNNVPEGEIHFENTNFLELYCLEGRDDYKIKGSDIIQLPNQSGHEQFGCAKTTGMALVNKSPRSSAQIRGLSV